MESLKKLLGSKWALGAALMVTAGLLSWQISTSASEGCFAKAFLVGSSVCHQIPSHSFIIGGIQFPVCARCSGLYLGSSIGIIAAFLQGKKKGIPNRYFLALLVVLFLLWSGDGLNSFISDILKRPFLYQTTNTTRLITGYGMGLVMSTALVTLFNNTVWNVANELPLLKNVWQIVGYAGLCVIISGLVLLNQKTPLLVGAYLTVIMVMVIISMLYTIFWIILLKRENTFQRARELTLMFLLGFCTALLQVLLFVNIRGLVF